MKLRFNHPYSLLIIFGLICHVVIAFMLAVNDLPFCFLPDGLIPVAILLLITMPIYSSCIILICEFLSDAVAKYRKKEVIPLRNRFINSTRIFIAMIALIIAYFFISIPYVNLKPAIPILNSNNYDVALESLERFVFFGVFPTEWLVNNSSVAAAYIWDLIYYQFALFMFLSVAIAVKFEGFSGGSVLTLSYGIGLFTCLMLALMFPTLGPIYVHPDWFVKFSNLSSYQLAAFLSDTVREYANRPGTVYGCSGIAAMPSYHIYACTVGFMYWRHLPLCFRIVGFIFLFLTWISTALLGWHYLLDGIAAVFLGYIVMKALWRLISRHDPI